MRASDPIFELGLALGGHAQEDKMWTTTLGRLAARFDVATEVDTVVVCAGQESVRGLYDDLVSTGNADGRWLIGGADVAAELDAKRAIEQGTRVAASLSAG